MTRRYAELVGRSVIVAAVRTPFGRLGGGLAKNPATELGAIAIREALARAGLEPGEVEYVIMGQVLQAGVGQAPARQAAVAAGIPKEVPADTINKVCASSIRALEIADLTSTFDGSHMVVQNSRVSRELGISREEQDAWAFRSQQRAAAAQAGGR